MIEEKVNEVLRFVELEDKKDTYVSQLSGGQKQRVGIARALTTTPDILLCDEATSALDPQTTESILKLLKKINKEMGVTILLITHQMQVVQMICNKVAVMENGKVVESGSVLDVFGKPQALVTKRFVQTVINDQIPESIVSLVKEQKEHFQVERLKFIGSSVKRPVISDICQVEGIVVNILGATLTRHHTQQRNPHPVLHTYHHILSPGSRLNDNSRLHPLKPSLGNAYPVALAQTIRLGYINRKCIGIRTGHPLQILHCRIGKVGEILPLPLPHPRQETEYRKTLHQLENITLGGTDEYIVEERRAIWN